MVKHKIEEQVAVFSALADPTRLRLVKLLCEQKKPDALCVNALASILGVTQSAVSQHLRVLKAIGLVRGERWGNHIHYSINPDAVRRCQDLMSAALNVNESIAQNACQNCHERKKENV